MIGDVTVTVTYMDGREDTIDGYQARAVDGVLHITQRMHSGRPDRHIPLANVREYTTRES
jgi:hypothetical protein